MYIYVHSTGIWQSSVNMYISSKHATKAFLDSLIGETKVGLGGASRYDHPKWIYGIFHPLRKKTFNRSPIIIPLK